MGPGRPRARPVPIARVVLHACDDDFNAIGPGFGFPTRFKVEASDDPAFALGRGRSSPTARARTSPTPARAGEFRCQRRDDARYVRVTATRLAPRQNDYNFALAELEVFDPTGVNVAGGAKVTALDTIEAPPRWRTANLVDGDYPSDDPGGLPALRAQRDAMLSEAARRGRSPCPRRGQPGSGRGRPRGRHAARPAACLRRDGPQRHRVPFEGRGRTAASLG